MTPAPTVQPETASNGDDSPADGIQRDDAGQQEREHHERCTALPGAVGLCVRNPGDADQKCNGEHHPAGLGEPKPPTEPSPIPSEARHAGSLGRRDRLGSPWALGLSRESRRLCLVNLDDLDLPTDEA